MPQQWGFFIALVLTYGSAMSAIYPRAKEDFLSGAINLSTDTIRVILVDTGVYTFSSSHTSLADIPAAARVTNFGGTAQALASKTVTSGIFDAADVSFSGLSSAPSFEAFVIYRDTGTESTSRLIAFIDSGTNLPTAANANTVNLAFDNGANRIFGI
jgi:hypothetical protein